MIYHLSLCSRSKGVVDGITLKVDKREYINDAKVQLLEEHNVDYIIVEQQYKFISHVPHIEYKFFAGSLEEALGKVKAMLLQACSTDELADMDYCLLGMVDSDQVTYNINEII